MSRVNNSRTRGVRCLAASILLAAILSPAIGHARGYASATPAVDDILEGDFLSKFHIAFGTYITTGFISSKQDSIATRPVNSLGAYAQLGLNSGYLVPYVIMGTSFVQQGVDSGRVSNTNMSGLEYLVGLGIRINAGDFYLSGAYLPWGTFELTNKTVTSETSTYSDPATGMLFVGYKLTSFSFFFVQKFAEFGKNNVHTPNDSLGDDKLLNSSLGVGAEWTW